MSPQPILKPRCLNCRKRKIKCDYKRPACTTCVQRNKECTYDSSLIFVNYEKEKTNEVATHVSKAAVRLRGTERPAISVLNTAYQDGLWQRFRSYYVENAGGTSRLFELWLEAQAVNDRANRMSSMASAALCLKVVGQNTSNRSMLNTSLMMGNGALALLRKQLSPTATEKQKKEMMLTVMIFLMADVCMMGAQENLHVKGRRRQEWLDHIPGVELCMQALGPHMFQSKDLGLLFQCCRTTLTTASIYTERTSFLASEKWKTIPFENIPKNPYHLAGDIFLDVPTLLESAQDVIHTTSIDDLEGNLEKFWNRFQGLETSWDTWLRVSGLYRDPRYRPIPSPEADFLALKQFPFKSLELTLLTILYYIGKFLQHEAVWRVATSHIVLPEKFADRFNAHVDGAPYKPAADYICIALDFCSQPQQGIVGKTFIPGAVKVMDRFYLNHGLHNKDTPTFKIFQGFREDGYLVAADFSNLNLDDAYM